MCRNGETLDCDAGIDSRGDILQIDEPTADFKLSSTMITNQDNINRLINQRKHPYKKNKNNLLSRNTITLGIKKLV